ncbi:MAG: GGDEF domain-containing phosphodiesterase [Rhodocyclaceae bacterium]
MTTAETQSDTLASPGLNAFMERLDAALRLHERQRTGFALLLISPPAGDAEATLAAIRGSVRHSDMVATLHAQQFGVLLSVGNEDGAHRVAGKIVESLSAALALGAAHTADIAIGIAIAPQHGQSREHLMRAADAALYQARRNRRGIVVAVAQEQAVPAVETTVDLGQHIGKAFSEGQFVLRFQPVVDLATSSLHAAEALLRWQHPVLGLLPPGEFLHLIERDGQADAIALQLIESAILQLRSWRDAGRLVPVSVNLNVQTLALDKLEHAIVDRLHALSLPPESFTVEIRDDHLADLPPAATRNLFALAAAGVRICLDDFGNGTASLTALRDLPSHEIKITARFASAVAHSEADAAITASLIQLGQKLGKRVVAKGIEDPAAISALAGLGCSHAQGFAFAQPLEASVLVAWQMAE